VAAQTLDGSFSGDVARALRESYTRGETYGSAFGKLMARLLAGRGVIFIDPLDARLHRLAAPVYLRALDEAGSLRDDLLARSKELEAAGFHAQVKVTSDTTLLFYTVNGRREPVRNRNGKLFAGDTEVSRDQLAAAFQADPRVLTPSALLRPIVQDTLLPTAAYLGGPAEVAYMAQTQAVYRKILGRMPAILPRSSFTIVEPAIARFLDQYGLQISDLFGGSQHMRSAMERKSLPSELAARFHASEETLRSMLKSYEEPLERLDATLVEALHNAERKILHQFDQVKGKVARAENFRSGVLDRHERILIDSLYPDGGLQERTLCALPLLASNGPALLDDLARFSSIADSGGGSPCGYGHHALFL